MLGFIGLPVEKIFRDFSSSSSSSCPSFLFVLFVDFPPVCNKETPLTQTNRISVRTHRHDLQETCIIFFRLLNLFLFFFLRSFFFFLFRSDVSFLSLGLFDDREKKEVGIQPV